VKLLIFIILLGAFTLSALFPGRFVVFMGLTITNLALYVAGLALILMEVAQRNHTWRRCIGLGPAVIIFAAVALSAVYAKLYGVNTASLLDNVRSAKSFVFEPVMLFLMAFLLVDSRENGERYLLYLVVVLGILNLTTVLASLLGMELHAVDPYDLEADSTSRFSGFTGNPNKTAYLSCLLVAFQYYFYRMHKANAVKILMATLMLGGLAIVMLSGSRGGVLVLAIMIAGLAYKMRDIRVLYASIVAIPLVVIVLMASGSEQLSNAIDRLITLSSGDMSQAMTGRDMIWASLWEDYTSDAIGILIGNGFGSAQYMGIQAPPHNIYLKVLVEFGIIGLLLFLYFIVKMFRSVNKMHAGDNDPLKTVIYASGAVVTVAWLFTTLSGILIFVWFMIGLATATLSASRAGYSIKPVAHEPAVLARPGRILARKMQAGGDSVVR
jgi:O-antigen ligase